MVELIIAIRPSSGCPYRAMINDETLAPSKVNEYIREQSKGKKEFEETIL